MVFLPLLCAVYFGLFYWNVSPSIPLAVCVTPISVRVGFLAPDWSVLFYPVLSCCTGTYPRPSLWPLPASLYREAGGARVPISTFLYRIFFTSHNVQRGSEGSTICSDSFVSCILSPADPWGPFYFGIPSRGMLACDHGSRPSQLLE